MGPLIGLLIVAVLAFLGWAAAKGRMTQLLLTVAYGG